ncbi:hypothetical protein SAMN04489713_114243 [Actinomadura madurae]|uniref:Uncharacterized protein n=1 Tax=Actinomadura madurae TaxID=1993 RepID=A0A1I5QSA5_9ACTN|nr:hypothetical protein SAMN04489713_114243 [Actinomadura madurae]
MIVRSAGPGFACRIAGTSTVRKIAAFEGGHGMDGIWRRGILTAGGDARTPFDVYAIQSYLADAVGKGTPPFAVASVDRWFQGGAVIDTLIPFLARRGLRTARVGLLGWSMGGDGVLRLAAEHGRSLVAAVVATSPAITDRTARSYARRPAGIPVWAACGSHDSFSGPTKEFLATVRDGGGHPEGGIYSGCHDTAFRRKMLPRQLAFLGSHLT